MNRIRLKAVILAILLVVVLDTIGGMVMMVLVGGSAFEDGMNEQQESEAVTAVTTSANALMGSMLLGTLSTMVGGYIAARIARKAPYMNAGVIGLFGIALGVLSAKDYPFWFNLLGFLLVLPAALLGGHLARHRK